jgi:hypothetical protein
VLLAGGSIVKSVKTCYIFDLDWILLHSEASPPEPQVRVRFPAGAFRRSLSQALTFTLPSSSRSTERTSAPTC